MLIYGPAQTVFSHTPEVCYQNSGFRSVPPTQTVSIKRVANAAKAPFSWGRYLRFVESGKKDYREVYHSFRNAGIWDIDMANNWRTFRYHPGMYKVQVQVSDLKSSEDTGEDFAISQLLESIVGVIDQQAAGQR